ncbi:MAG TPA: methionine--tRNA ligase [Hyphomicrobiaceae bacterium]|nr:methionine--tRNA ligase [Hyphomicrobiaceae bacterium]
MTRYLVTSALPYVNGVKHLGNLVGSLLPADVHARFRRQTGAEVLFICATDEHGTPTELSAAAAGQDVGTFCKQQHAIQADIYRRFGLSFDHFGRSSSAQNRALTQHFYRRLEAAGLIEERDVEQVWSPTDNRFLPDRYILGTCPHCRYEAARGDQCDGCGALLDPPELLAPRSAVSGSRDLALRTSPHLFLRQSLLVDRLRAWVDHRHGWPAWVTSLAHGWLTSDLRDRCITRDLAWGVPVPRPGFEAKVFYVWFDAPITYLAATKEWSDAKPSERDWRSWWWQADDLDYVQFLGKDNVPFHAVSFPATLLGSGEPWKTVDVIKGFHWLTYAGGKFSTSQRRGVFTDTALDALPADLWRWWLIANAPESADVDFDVRRFSTDVGKDLADVFGNLATRATTFACRAFDGRIPAEGEPGSPERALAHEVERRIALLRSCHERLAFRRAAAETRGLWGLANGYLHEQAPWTTIKSDPARAAVTTRAGLNLLALCAAVSWSIVPTLASRVLAAFGELGRPPWPAAPVARQLAGRKGQPLARIDPLVSKLTETEIARLERRFSGGAESVERDA